MIYKTKVFLGILSLLGLWSLLLFQLSITWETNEQYAHGFLVPFLCLFLLLKVTPDEVSTPAFIVKRKHTIIYCVGMLLLLSLFPIWLVRGANSDWRLVNLVLFLVIFLLSILHFLFLKDKNFQIRSFLFPLLFFLVAIPWPLATDLKASQWLQEKISTIIVDILLILENEAKLEGTVIDVGVFGKVGIDQACSGINGLQASLVVSIFLGAYFSFTLLNRLILVLGGLIIALLCNLCRAFSLSFIKVKGKGHYIEESLFSVGEFALPNLHELMGFIETGLIFISILLLARLSKKELSQNSLAAKPFYWSNLAVCPPIGFSTCSIIVVISATVLTEYHYLKTEKDLLPLPRLNLNIDDSDIVLIEKEISNQISSQLHFADAKSIQWQNKIMSKWNPFGFFEINPNHEHWQAFEANWDSGGACTAVLSTHSPESCLPLTGLVQISPTPGSDPIIIPVKIENRVVFFEAYEFIRSRKKLFVFRCFWPKKLAPEQPNLFPQGGYNFSGRLDATFKGQRNVGGTMLALALANVDSSQTAISKLQLVANQRLSFDDSDNQ